MKRQLLILLLINTGIFASEPTHFTLDNGLKVIVMEKHSIPVAAVQVWYDVGSHDEWDGIRGTAHLFEHMMFRGTENYESEEHARLINEAGGYNNAFTSDDVTVYHERLPSGKLELALKLEAERMHLLKLNEDILATEREVVHEEYRQRNANPIGKLFLKFRGEMYPEKHPYAVTPIGIMDQLDTVSVKTCQTFYDMHYGPENATLVIVGDVDLEKTKVLVNQYFGVVRPLGTLPENPDLSIPTQTEKVVLNEESSFDLPVTLMGFPVPGSAHDDIAALDVLSYIMSNGQSSRLNQVLVREKQLALGAGGFPMSMKGPGIFIYFSFYFPQVSSATIEKAIMDIVQDIRENGVAVAELSKARKQMLAGKVFERYSANSLASSLGNAELVMGDYREFNTEIERFNAVTADDVQRVANAYFTEEKMTIMHIQPENLSFLKKCMFWVAGLFM
ncbi:MAG: insulinase family protein [Candidatus Marinimicrobia bacterium]|jgi:predicted Zn-dependent peptidase|nr:insulinase family protein [Candidatus Neomarinimicrobiota bacterium]MBT3617883.1 insulinase family protein [Candidatus Neomarinimicrobiota bacterium]MBT3828720.1 insulinase family protein [Candidatus Neomarinimicrobiota bacterium]MBT3996658.1 insulinase family protein [Candidatus Neomarinimicrobiota bacterium]MBT4280422.1 insulinase family protein [Candidatus Neomarinimicrobiota bacterium]